MPDGLDNLGPHYGKWFAAFAFTGFRGARELVSSANPYFRRRRRAIDLAFAFDRLGPSKHRPLARLPIYFRYEKWPGPRPKCVPFHQGTLHWAAPTEPSASARLGPHLFLCRSWGRESERWGIRQAEGGQNFVGPRLEMPPWRREKAEHFLIRDADILNLYSCIKNTNIKTWNKWCSAI